MAKRPDYDSAWKDALAAYFPEFLLLMRPETHARIDWSHPPKFLDKELQSLARSAARGRRHVDKLVSVRLRDGQEVWLLIHVEVQTRCEAGFAARMLDYHIRLKTKYPGHRLLNLAVLTGKGPVGQMDADQVSHSYEAEGCSLVFTFPVIRLETWRSRLAELSALAPSNPFAVVALVQLEATAIHDAPARLARKIELVRQLKRWGFGRDNRNTLFRAIDAMLHLPDALEADFEAAVMEIEEEEQMAYVTSIERVRLRRERAQGLEEGIQQGVQLGKKQGQIQGATEVLATLINGKFGSLPDWARARMDQAGEAELNQWALRILDAQRIEDVFA